MPFPLLEVRDLRIDFDMYEGTFKVLDGFSLVVQKGEKVGIVGETGCGKSITMQAALGILPMPPGRISSGEIRFLGKDLLTANARDLKEIRSRISLIPQDPSASLNPVFKVGTQLMDVIKYSASSRGQTGNAKERRRLALNALKEVGLPDPERNMNSYPIQLSGGMQQRILIAMALVTEPELLIADEPSTALDVTIQDQILRLMKEIVDKRQLTIVIITHNLGVVRELTDRTYVMYAGQLAEVARTKHLFSQSKHPYTQGLIKSVPKLTGEGISSGIEGMIPDYSNPPNGCRFRPRCEYAMAICEEKPPDFVVEEEHKVACFLYRK
ncbi:ABC transporter ATP-binding protein [Candidatus Bipolaricaulota bacterium]|nr:ABC transporter ATP-binding protein [Candidatus Bipolaricaulota bacterium]MCK4391530.1 ABC transporter ATP-binding protein [Candidatus Bipolaricaulota bacterium]MCK4598412.1 ABC transporter ATP-binding protein [Candidatus Bipolaricaulota bacterium]